MNALGVLKAGLYRLRIRALDSESASQQAPSTQLLFSHFICLDTNTLSIASVCAQVGVASIASGVQRAGGSTAHPGTALDEALEQKAAYIEGGASPETSSLGQHAIVASMPHYDACLCAISDVLHVAAARSKMWSALQGLCRP